jgi:hypothetical protein
MRPKEVIPFKNTKGKTCNILSSPSCVLNCKKRIDKAKAKKEAKSPYQAKAKEDRMEVITKTK